MFIVSVVIIFMLKPAHTWTLFILNMFVYLMASAASVFDIVVVVVGAPHKDDTTLGYPDNLLKIRMTFGMILACVELFSICICYLFPVGLTAVALYPA
jgi:hypothetical protein